jgi:hypothetical protein
MLNGDKVVLRPVRERDLAAFIDAHTEISNRGEFFPLGIQPEPVLRRNYAETGFWERDDGWTSPLRDSAGEFTSRLG